MVEFNEKLYGKFIESTNEKDLLVNKISNLLKGNLKNSCLEIGLGIPPYFAKKLSKEFDKYVVLEKRLIKEKLPNRVELITADWENAKINQKFDVIIASHVIYYFKDKKKALEKMLSSLNEGGKIFFVVNGKTSDYGPLKYAFSKMIKSKCIFTYEELISLLKNKKYKEYSLPSTINFDTYNDLFDTLRLSFDTYPIEYEKFKKEIIKYFEENIKGKKFVIDQKIIEVNK